VDDAVLMGGSESVSYLGSDASGFGPRYRASSEAFGEILALDVLHHQEVLAFDLLEAVEGGDVGVVEGGEKLRLALEAGPSLRVPGEGLR
jgi:hypothetical protein